MRWLNSDTLEITVYTNKGIVSKLKSEEVGIHIIYVEYSEKRDSLFNNANYRD